MLALSSNDILGHGIFSPFDGIGTLRCYVIREDSGRSERQIGIYMLVLKEDIYDG